MSSALPLVTDFHRLALDDGPGIRTTVFLKGCPLSCAWCHNPEAIRPGPQIGLCASLCVGAGDCVRRCTRGALVSGRPPVLARDRCDGCGDCAEACPSTALRLLGRRYEVAELVRELLEDRVFYDTSGGGVTFSGGEPTMFIDYLAAVARELKRAGVHLAIETAGTFDWAAFRAEILPQVDLIYFDLKLADPEEHRRWTGQDNARILRNFANLCAERADAVVARVPLVPGITNTEANLSAISELVARHRPSAWELLPYHPGGLQKRANIGQPAPAGVPDRPLSIEEERHAREVFARGTCAGATSMREMKLQIRGRQEYKTGVKL